MKRTLLLTAITALLASCSQPEPGVHLNLSDWQTGDSVKVFKCKIMGSMRDAEVDTLAIPEGGLFIPTSSETPQMFNFYKMPRRYPDGSMEAMSMRGVYVPVMPGAAVNIEGSAEEYTYTGNTTFYKELSSIEPQIKSLRAESFKAARASYNKDLSEAQRDSLQNLVQGYENEIQETVVNFAKANNTSDAALFVFYTYANLEKNSAVLDQFATTVKEGPLADIYTHMIQSLEAKKKQKEAEQRVADGMQAPDFTLKNIKGEDVTLSSLRGKYIVLDFWGSWCGWCIKGIPEMKKMYAKYQKQLEVVGIACRDSEEVWKKSVADNKLPWTNLLNGNGENDVTVTYAIKGYPTKIILDSEGKIVKTILGESPEFYTTIDSLMTK